MDTQERQVNSSLTDSLDSICQGSNIRTLMELSHSYSINVKQHVLSNVAKSARLVAISRWQVRGYPSRGAGSTPTEAIQRG